MGASELVSYVLFATQQLIGTMLFFPPRLRRLHVSAPNLVVVLALGCLGFALLPLFASFAPVQDIVPYSVAGVCASVASALFAPSGARRFLYALCAGSILRAATSKLATLVLLLAPVPEPAGLARSLFVTVCFLLACVPAYLLFKRNVRLDADFVPTAAELVACVMVCQAFTPLALLEPYAALAGPPGEVCLLVMEVLLGYGYLAFQLSMRRHSDERAILARESEARRMRLLQYESLRGVIEAMNVKSHDLKHQVRTLAEGGRINAEALASIEEVLAEYDSFVSTGNEALDALLTEKAAACRAHGIELSTAVDGPAFSFLTTEETNALFGNLIDNAIEHLAGAAASGGSAAPEAGPRREISVTSVRSDLFLKLTVENPLLSPVRPGPEGRPLTTKAGEGHGLGTLSVERIAYAHGGSASLRAEDGCFRAQVIFPTSV